MTDATTTTEETPRLNRRQAAKLRTFDKVLAAARREFETRGYKEGTIRNIAKGAGMSTGAVFASFDDKDTLYIAAMGHKPITPEQGRAFAMSMMDIALGDMSHAAITERAAQAVEAMLEAVPGLADAWAAERERQPHRADGIPFRQYVKGAHGEIVDVTHL